MQNLLINHTHMGQMRHEGSGGLRSHLVNHYIFHREQVVIDMREKGLMAIGTVNVIFHQKIKRFGKKDFC